MSDNTGLQDQNDRLSSAAEPDLGNYKLITWKNPGILHWLTNPGIAFAEIFLGQRIPKRFYKAIKPVENFDLMALYPCPHCETLHTTRTYWNRGIKNWFGLYCPACGDVIPCLWNLTSLLILTCTAPFWVWFYKPLKRSWLAKQAIRYSIENGEPQANIGKVKKLPMLLLGLLWGAMMYVFFVILYRAMGYPISAFGYKAIVLCLCGGLLWGASMIVFLNRYFRRHIRQK